LKARFGLPWVVDYRDPWAHGLAKLLPPTWRARLERLKERMVLRAADGIVVNTPLARQALVREVPELAPKMTAITNGYDPQSFASDDEPPKQPATFSIVHTGEIYSGRDPRPLFDALASMQPPPHTKPLRLTFLGQSSDPRHDWPGEARRLGLENIVEFTGHVSYHEALGRMKRADILLLLDTSGRRVGIPAKLFEYFGARRPILALAESQGDVAWALGKSGLPHRIAAPDDSGKIRQALHELINQVTRPPAALPQPSVEEFTRGHMAARLASFLNQTMSKRRSGVGASEPPLKPKLPATSWAASGCAAWQQPHGVLP
jgi:glycosyltransferase involved in cell wall biosynthesis